MGKAKVDWHTRPADIFKKDIVLDRFRRYLKGIGLKDETIKLYLCTVGGFLEYAKCEDPGFETANKYRSMLVDQGLSKGHINNTCFGIRKFYEMDKQTWDFPFLKPNEGIPYYFDDRDVQAIFSVCSNIKHLAMLQVLFFGCLRSSEMCKLDDGDLDFRTKSMRLRETKNGSDGIAYMNDECAETLRIYLKIRPELQIGDRTPLFYTDAGNVWVNNDVHRMFTYYKKKAGITKPGAVHVFSRHTTATMMIAKGCDIRIVKELLRHKDIRTTLRYAHVSDKTKREKYDQFLVL